MKPTHLQRELYTQETQLADVRADAGNAAFSYEHIAGIFKKCTFTLLIPS
jgi:hypothetical protein